MSTLPSSNLNKAEKVAAISEILNSCSKTERISILRMVAIEDDLTVRPVMALANLAGSQRTARAGATPPKRSGGPARGPTPKEYNRNPEVLAIKAELDECLKRIRTLRSEIPNSELPREVLQERDTLLGRLHEAKVRGGFRPPTDPSQVP